MAEVPQAEPAIVAPAAPAVIDAPDSIDDVRAVLTMYGLAENAACFITCHGITGMEDFEYMEYNEFRSIVKMYNDRYRGVNQKIGFPVQK